MRADTWDTTAAVHYDQQLWNELATLRFAEAAHGALILGPVGVGKTHPAPPWATSPSAAASPST
jgi:DNA replication protein DnaC